MQYHSTTTQAWFRNEKSYSPTPCEADRAYCGGCGVCWTVPEPDGVSTSIPTDEPADVEPEGVAEYSSFEQPFSKLNPEKSESIVTKHHYLICNNTSGSRRQKFYHGVGVCKETYQQ